MSGPEKVTKEMEELSRLLDEMNSGKCPASGDGETADLLAIAALVKKAAVPVRPPQHVLDSIIGQTAGSSGKKRRISAWLYSGVLGIAASVMLVVGLHLTPLLPTEYPSAPSQAINEGSLPPNQQPEQQLAAADLKESDTQKAVPSVQTASDAVLKLPPPQAVANTPARTQPPAEVHDKSAGIGKSGLTKTEQLSEKSALNTGVFKRSVAPASEKNSPGMIPLSLPGKTPDSIIVDKGSHTIRQVYDQGTPREIIITQRMLSPEKSAWRANSQEGMLLEKGDIEEEVHRETVVIAGQEISIEGRLPQEELRKLAGSIQLP